jgi:predicted MFS family arabinose efflux permease
VFALNALSFVGVIIVVNGYRGGPPRSRGGEDVNAAIRDGLRHVLSAAALRHPLIRLASMTAAGAGLVAVMPLVARQRLHVSAAGFGVLSAALGLGSVGAVWVMPRLRSAEHPERAIGIAALVWSFGAALFALAGQLWVGIVAMVLAGAGTMGTISVLFANYTLQLATWMRGRGSALAMLMVWLGTTIGALGWGGLASGVGIRTSLLAAAACNLAIAGVGRLCFVVRRAPSPTDQLLTSTACAGPPSPTSGS